MLVPSSTEFEGAVVISTPESYLYPSNTADVYALVVFHTCLKLVQSVGEFTNGILKEYIL